MLENFQLAVLVQAEGETELYKIPLHQALQTTLANSWELQLDTFVANVEEVDFDPAYNLEDNQRFRLIEFDLPASLAEMSSENAQHLNSISEHEDLLERVRAIACFAERDGSEIVLLQNFSRSHVIRPGQFLFLRNDTYQSVQNPGLTLEARLSAVYWPDEKKLLFQNFRTVNTFLPLADIYREASEEDIREVLAHDRLAAEDADALALDANQWFRKRFALLRDSGILDEYTPKQLQTRSKRYGIAIKIANGKVVFPSDRPGAKRLLQFLNEEIFRGAVTENLYETNSKRKADT